MNNELLSLIKKLHISQENNNSEEEIKNLVKLGEYHYKKNNLKKSEISFKDALNKDSKLEGINYYLALIKLQDENYFIAKKYLKKELEINKNNEDALILLEKLEINSNFPLITLSLVFLNILVFFFTYPEIELIELIKFTLNESNLNLISGITSTFFHLNLIHISINMIFLLMFGLILEKAIGSFKFLSIYIIAGIFGNLIQAFLTPEGFVLGASAAIFGIVGSVLLREPLLNIRIFGIIKVPIILLFGGFFSISAILQNYLISNTSQISGEISHIFGFLIGIFLTSIFYREKIFVFYNWVLIAFGFFILGFSFEMFLNNFINNSFDLLTIFIIFISLIMSIFVITYSYLNLKNKIIGCGEK